MDGIAKPPEQVAARWVLITEPLLALLQEYSVDDGGWSAPVQIRIDRDNGSELQLALRTYSHHLP